ncbi:MAG: hypothetical protein QT02_C0002G0007 [archaeon GW2011_AR9]|nr:MAG: hypothetical protein QT02_C0002G0007 [archaeon GW2011_AR9]
MNLVNVPSASIPALLKSVAMERITTVTSKPPMIVIKINLPVNKLLRRLRKQKHKPHQYPKVKLHLPSLTIFTDRNFLGLIPPMVGNAVGTAELTILERRRMVLVVLPGIMSASKTLQL